MTVQPLVWDGARRVGPLALGMLLEDVQAALPSGAGYWFEQRGELDYETYFWDDDAAGLSAHLCLGMTISITAHSFVYSGQELVGMSAEAAISLLGGETERDEGEPICFVETASGAELAVEDDAVLWVTLWASEEEIDSL